MTNPAAAPSLTMLIKLLKMTTSSHDAEALVAVRKANAELAKFGGDWDTLLRGKVTVIGDPFADLAKPQGGIRPGAGRPQSPPPPQPKPQPRAAAQPHPQPKPQPAPQPRPQPAPTFTTRKHQPGSVQLDELI